MNMLYRAIEQYVDHQLTRAETTGYWLPEDYLPCGWRPGQEREPDGLGSVERKILAFFDDPKGGWRTGVLRGQVGCGKTTTLQHLRQNYLISARHNETLEIKHRLVISLDFNPKLRNYQPLTAAQVSRSSSARQSELMELGSTMSSWYSTFVMSVKDRVGRYWDEFCGSDYEFGTMWNWALSPSCDPELFPGAEILGAHREEIHLCAGEGGLLHKAREALLVRLWSSWSDQQRLTYLALKISFLIHNRFGGRASGVCLILDNIDPFPITAHDQLIDACFRFCEVGKCRGLVASRPATLNNSRRREQGSYRVFDLIEHEGPRVSDVLIDRLQRYGLGLKDQELRQAFVTSFAEPAVKSIEEDPDGLLEPDWLDLAHVKPDVIHERAGADYIVFGKLRISFAVLRCWFRFLSVLLTDDGVGAGRPGSFAFVLNNLSGGSIRFGKLMFQAFCSSDHHVKWQEMVGYTEHSIPSGLTYLEVPEDTEPRDPSREKVTIRALVCGSSRAVSNHDRNFVCNMLYSLGPKSGSPLLKSRVLDFLIWRTTRPTNLGQLWEWLAKFGYADEVVRAVVNNLKHERRRLIELDSWTDLDGESIMAYHAVSVALGPSGEFYRKHALYNIDYVQECLPESDVADEIGNAHGQRLVDRLRSVRLGLVAIAAKDAQDIRIVIMNGGLVQYKQVYGASIVGRGIADAIAPAAIAVLQSVALGRPEPEIDAEIAAWTHFLPRELSRIYAVSEAYLARK